MLLKCINIFNAHISTVTNHIASKKNSKSNINTQIILRKSYIYSKWSYTVSTQCDRCYSAVVRHSMFIAILTVAFFNQHARSYMYWFFSHDIRFKTDQNLQSREFKSELPESQLSLSVNFKFST